MAVTGGIKASGIKFTKNGSNVSWQFTNFTPEINGKIEDAAQAFLAECSALIIRDAADNTQVDTGQLKASWRFVVDDSTYTSTIGSSLTNAIWNEYGTGIYAVEGNGRKTPWFYEDRHGEGHFTHGKRPQHSLQKAFDSNKTRINKRAADLFGKVDD